MRQVLIARLTWTARVINHHNCLLKVRGVCVCVYLLVGRLQIGGWIPCFKGELIHQSSLACDVQGDRLGYEAGVEVWGRKKQ